MAHDANGNIDTIGANASLTTPRITTSIDDSAGNEIIKTPATASAVNETTVTNAATGNAPQIAATGDDTNIDLEILGKGTGSPRFSGVYDGWVKANETWTYASASTITVPSGAASKYAIGDRVKFTQTTVKYGVIVAVADTLLTLQANSDYSVANAAITLNYYSHEANPVGYPHWFALASPTFTVANYDDGAGGQPTSTYHRMSLTGRTVTIHYSGNGTKAGTNPYIIISASTMPAPVNVVENLTNLGTFWAGDTYQGTFNKSTNPYILISTINIPDNTTITYLSFVATYEI